MVSQPPKSSFSREPSTGDDDFRNSSETLSKKKNKNKVTKTAS